MVKLQIKKCMCTLINAFTVVSMHVADEMRRDTYFIMAAIQYYSMHCLCMSGHRALQTYIIVSDNSQDLSGTR